MEGNERKKKVWFIVEIIVLSLFLALFIACLVIQLSAPDGALSRWMKENVWDIKKTVISLKSHVPTLINSLIYIILVYAVCKVLRLIFSAKMQKSPRSKTICSLLDGFVKYACAIAIIILILKACGVNTTALVASIGVLTLVVGLGAQPLIADIIAGIFIIFEDEYHVGEIVTINDFRGTVMEIGIRSTKLLDAAGNIKIINNSAIGDVINLSRELSLAIVDCDFPYDVPIEFVENILQENFEKIAENIPQIKEGPYYKGVCMYKDSNVTIKIVAKCLEEDRFQVERDLNREYRRIITENGIDIAYPQVVVNYPSEKAIKVTKKEKQAAKAFSEEQGKISKNIEEQQL
ncbi:MAG: mechanosensitive ion channel family protein [Clostridiales bacterium]|nr:mechanosensitive ion channel family protein [Clostridiales bacterium]